MIGKYGFAVFHPCESGVYHLHAGVLPKGRGKWALNAMKAALDVMFSRYAVAIIAAIPRDNRAARNLAAAAGFQLLRVFPDAWPTANGRTTALHAYLLLRSDWIGPVATMRTQ
jgi:RimJ/RimL family protein N-acetyltransferase